MFKVSGLLTTTQLISSEVGIKALISVTFQPQRGGKPFFHPHQCSPGINWGLLKEKGRLGRFFKTWQL